MANKKRVPRITKTKDFPVTLGMLYGVRDELRSDIAGVRSDMKAGFQGVESRFQGVEARFKSMDSHFQKMDSRFHQMDARLHQMESRMHQMHLLAEEQNARNKIVMDEMISLFHRQDRCESSVETMEKTLSGLKR